MTFEQTNVTHDPNIALATSAGASTFAPPPPSVGGALDDAGDIQNPIAHGGVTDDRQPTFQGQGTPGDTIVIRDNGNEIGTTEVDDNGTWSFTPSTDLLEGLHAITVVTRDDSGNESAPSPAFDFEIDVTPPDASRLAITGVADSVGGVTGNVAPGATTDDTRPLLSGNSTGVPGHTVTVMVRDAAGTHELGQAVIGENGQWTFQVDTPLAAGANTFTLVERDAAGNETAPTGRYTVNVITDKPSAPVIDSVFDDVGTPHMLQPGEATNDARPTLAGTAQANHTVKFYDGSTLLGQVVADASGQWSFTPQTGLADGTHGITATSTSPLGQTSEASGSWNFVVDTTPPVKPTIVSVVDDVGSITGSVALNGVTDDARPGFSGKAEANSTVVIYDHGVEIDRVPTNAAGDWTYTPTTPLADGAHSITVAAVDKAGNTSAPSDMFGFTVDATAPAAPTIERVADDVGLITDDIVHGGVTDDYRPWFKGSAEANSTVILYNGAKEIGRVQANADGVWGTVPAANLANGVYTITVVSVDEAGNISQPSVPFSFTVDRVAPTKPTIVSVEDDVGPVVGSVSKGGLTDDAQPKLTGKAEANSTVIIYDKGVELARVQATASGNWEHTPTEALSQGAHNITVTAMDKAGNVSVASDAFGFTVDTVAPAKPTIVSVIDDVGSITGNVALNGVTDDARPGFSGKAEANSTVVIYDHGVELTKVTANASGDWTWTPTTALGQGAHSVTVAAVDKAGNTSVASDAFGFTVDSVAPTQTATVSVVGKDSGFSEADYLTNDGGAGRLLQGKLSAVLGAGETLQVSTDGGATWKAAFVSGTAWSAQDDSSHAGNWAVQTRVIDAAGNVGAVQSQAMTLDAAAPMAPTKVVQVGTGLEVQFNAANVAAGHKISLVARDGYFEYTLTAADIAAGKAFISAPVPPVVSFESIGNTAPAKLLSHGDLTITSSDDFRISGGISGYGAIGNSLLLGDGGSWDGHVTTFRFSEGKDFISFTIGGLDGLGDVKFYDLSGNLINTQKIIPHTELPSSNSFQTISFQSPLNTKIGYFVITAATDNRTIFDNLQTGLPLDLSSGVSAAIVDPAGNVSQYWTSAGLKNPAASQVLTDASEGTAHGGAGNNEFVVSDVRHLADSAISGNGGTDTLKLTGANQLLDLTALGHKVSSVEIIDITGTGNNTLALSLADVMENGAMNQFVTNGRVQMMVKGNAGDKVSLMDVLPNGTDPGDWVKGTNVTVGGVVYEVYQHSGFKADLLVQQGVAVTLQISIDQVMDDVGAITGPIANGGFTDDTTPTLTGKSIAGGTVKIYDGNTLLGQTVVTAGGSWSYTPGTPLGEGLHSLRATVTPVGGSESARTAAFDLTVDRTAPTKPTIVSVMDDVGSVVGKVALNGTTDDTRPAFSGKAEANSTVVIYDKGVKLMQVQADASGNWSWTPATALGNGVHTITVTAVDKAGSASVASDAFGFTVATTPPSKPTIVSAIDDVEAVTGAITSGSATNDAKPTFSGKADANGTVIIYDKGVEIDRVQANASGNWTYTPAKALGEGAHSITVAGADPAGNTSAQSGAFDLTVDTTPPVLVQGGLYMKYHTIWWYSAVTIDLLYNSGLKEGDVVVMDFGGTRFSQEITEAIVRHGSFYFEFKTTAKEPLYVAIADAAGNMTAFMHPIYENNGLPKWVYPVSTFALPGDAVMADDNIIDSPTQAYTESDDTLIARLGFADRLEGGAGNDTFTQVGTGDTVHGGAGDDVIRVNSGDFIHIDGGLGIDTLVMDGKAMHIDLSALGPKVQGVEKFDLGAGGNTLALSTHDVLAGGARDMVVADGKVQMLVNGANGEVDLLGGTHGDDGWTQGSNATVGGVTYHVYTNLAGTAELLVEDKVHVTIL